MNAGVLSEKIEIYEPVVKKTEYGDSKIEYEWFYTTRANVKYDTGSRLNENDEIFYSITRTFIIRHYVQVNEKFRIKYDGKFYRIISIEPNKIYNNKVIITELVNE